MALSLMRHARVDRELAHKTILTLAATSSSSLLGGSHLLACIELVSADLTSSDVTF